MTSSWAFALACIAMLGACSASTAADGGSGGGSGGGTASSGGGSGGGSAALGGGTGDAGGGTTATGGGTSQTLRPYVFVGSGDSNIRVFTLEPTDAGLTLVGTYPSSPQSTFLAMHPSKRWLYATSEGDNKVSAYAVGDAGHLDFLNAMDSRGSDPAYVSVEPSGRYVLVANYGGGTVSVFPILDGGFLGASTSNPAPGLNAHMILDVGGNVFVPCLGSDHIAEYALDAGVLIARNPPFVATATGAGPRHIDVHPNRRWAYVMDETNSTMSAYDVDAGQLSFKNTYSTLPAGFTGTNTGAEIFVHPNGTSVYGSNRGDNSIVHFHIEADGTLTLVGHTPTGGVEPRNFGLSPDGTLMLVANQMTGNIVALRIDVATGNLTSLGEVAQVPSAEYVGIVQLP